MSSQAWPRSAAPHCSLPREGRSQGLNTELCRVLRTLHPGTTRRRTCSQGGPHLLTTSYARPAGTQLGLTGPLPSEFGGRTTQKIISRAHQLFAVISFPQPSPQLFLFGSGKFLSYLLHPIKDGSITRSMRVILILRKLC